MSAPIARPRLLIVESDDSVRRVLGRFLSPRFEITPLEHGRSAIGRLKEERFDLLLLDLAVKDVTAVELLREVRAIDPKLPVLLTSPTPNDAKTNEPCVMKPFDAPELARAIDLALAPRSARR